MASQPARAVSLAANITNEIGYVRQSVMTAGKDPGLESMDAGTDPRENKKHININGVTLHQPTCKS